MEPLATTKPKTSAKDFFLHVLNIITLYATAISATTLLWQLINFAIPDVLQNDVWQIRSYGELARSAIAWLVVMAPVFFVSSRHMEKMYRAVPEKRLSRVRHWLLYFTLFAAALIIIGFLIGLVMSYLDGELTMRFTLKILAVFATAGSIFGYYFWDIKNEANIPSKGVRYFIGGVIAVIIASLVAGVLTVGTPTNKRLDNLDGQRIRDLDSIYSTVVSYWNRQNPRVLPETLAQTENKTSGISIPSDPETKAVYEYRVIDDLSFELCATFSLKNGGIDSDYMKHFPHDVGRTCFTMTIDPTLYPKSSTMSPSDEQAAKIRAQMP